MQLTCLVCSRCLTEVGALRAPTPHRLGSRRWDGEELGESLDAMARVPAEEDGRYRDCELRDLVFGSRPVAAFFGSSSPYDLLQGHGSAWRGEYARLAVGLCAARLEFEADSTFPRMALSSRAALPAEISVLLSMAALRSSMVDRSRRLLAGAIAREPQAVDAWTLAIWAEAAHGDWEAASALAHTACVKLCSHARLWHQWNKLEGFRGSVEAQLRLRALASAAGISLAGRT